MLSTVLYYELAMKVPIPVGITVYLLTWGLGHLRCLVLHASHIFLLQTIRMYFIGSLSTTKDYYPPQLGYGEMI